MAVLARSAGLPARWVKGYAPGAYSFGTIGEDFPIAVQRIAKEIDKSGYLHSSQLADAHSWVEIYFDGYGWIPFEPTSGFTYPYTGAASTNKPEQAEPVKHEESESSYPSQGAKEESAFNIPSYVPLVGIAVFITALSCWLFVRRQWLADRWTQYRARAFTAEQRMMWETEKLVKTARRRGLNKDEHETLREAVVRWSSERSSLQVELDQLLRILSGRSTAV